MSHRVPILAVLALAFALPAPASAAGEGSWAQTEIQLVTSHGLMGGSVAAFRPNDPLTNGELAALVSGLTGRSAPMPGDPTAPATIPRLDAQLVGALGLDGAARRFLDATRAAGLSPPGRFGTEAVARLLGLRANHPATDDGRELLPDQPATHAEAAYSAAKILRFAGWEVKYVRDLATTFAPPSVSGVQQQVLQTAIRFIGYPYVWGGTSERPQQLFGRQANGGFDCSGFVWRVYKQERYAGAEALQHILQGRTTFEMSAEVGRRLRVGLEALEPGDLAFFGPNGRRSKPAEITHMGIYLGGGWFIQSSEQGVALSPIAGWYEKRFAWGRRPLAELPPA